MMDLPASKALIEEAVETNFKDVETKSQAEYKADLIHYAEYLESKFELDMLSAEREHVRAFMNHLKAQGGNKPADSRKGCAWCKDRGYPMGRGDKPLSESRCKKYLSALRFLYHHTLESSAWPSVDPTAGLAAPKVTITRQFVPSRKEMRLFLDDRGDMRERMLAYFFCFVPARREEIRNARWKDIYGLDEGSANWEVPKAKGGSRMNYAISPKLRAMLREYKVWQERQAQSNPRVAAALADEDTAYLFLSQTGRQINKSTINKMINRRAVKAKIGLRSCSCTDSVNGFCSKLTPHTFRRAWAEYALNDERKPVSIDVVSEALGHKDITTTRRHYAHTSSNRVTEALLDERI